MVAAVPRQERASPMATATDNQTQSQTQSQRRIDSGGASNSPAPRQSNGLARRFVILAVVVAILAALAYGATQLLGSSDGDTGPVLSTYEVQPNELLITVTEDGKVESASNIEVKCEVAGGSSILWIVTDGENVKEGDKIVELDSSALEDEINGQKITYNKAKSTLIQAQKDFDVAKISVEEYLQGTFKKEIQDAETLITIAEENLRSSKNSLEYSERMFQRGYISSLELESQQFAVQRAQLELDSANTGKEVLEKFTRVKTLEELRSAVETAEANLESEQAAFELEKGKLDRLETQLENCTIFAPQDGMVVYANEGGGRFGQQTAAVEEGAAVRDRQTILRLPDLSQMQVKVNVHETKVEDLQRDMRARVSIQGRDYQGTVVSIANQPEATSFFQGNVKEYATIVKIDGQPEGLRPGMTAEAEILIAQLKGVLTLPVSAIVERRAQYLCWVRTPAGKVERRELVLGQSDDQFVHVKDGVASGDQVVRNPRAVVDEASAGQLVAEEQVDVSSKFGEGMPSSSSSEGDAMPGPRGRGGPGQGGPMQGAPGQGGRGEPGASGPDRGSRGGRAGMKQYDADGDGKVSKEEAPAKMRPFFDKIDPNGDGFLDSGEIKKLESQFRAGGAGRPGGGAGRPGGASGRGPGA